MTDLVQRLNKHVDVLADLIGPRHLGLPRAIAAAAAYITKSFEEMGYGVESQSYDAGGATATNLIVEQVGGGKSQEIIVLGAHYDSTPNTPGADDNASAIAVLLEVARLLRNHSGRRTLRFVAFACEEPPYFYTETMGSQVYARRCRSRGEQIIGMLCLEMVGFYSEAHQSQRLPAGIPRFLHCLFPRRGDFLAAVGNMKSVPLSWKFRRGFNRGTSFPLFSICLPEAISEIRLSDNSSFWDQGYPALMLTDTSFLRNPHYHQWSDTPDTLDYRRMADVTRGVAGAIKYLISGRVSLEPL